MIVIAYTPPDEKEQQHWEVREDSWTVAEVRLIEKMFGDTRPKFFDAVKAGSDTARILLLWIVRLRDEPSLALGDLDDLKVPYLFFGQMRDPEQGVGVDADPKADPKDTPNNSSNEGPAPSTE